MIGKLSGIIDEIGNNYIILNVNNVGYLVYAISLHQLKLNDHISIKIKTIVKEDSFDLYGFFHQEDYLFFNTLIQINGIGPKMALNILDKLGATKLQTAINAGDQYIFKQISGVGPKIAAKILLELKGKVIIKLTKPTIFYEATAALQQIGFEDKEIEVLLNKIMYDHEQEVKINNNKNLTLEDIVQKAIIARNS